MTGYLARPVSRGSVLIKSYSPRDYPAIKPNFLSDESDRRTNIAMVRRLYGLLCQPSMSRIIKGFLPPFSPAMINDDEAPLAMRSDEHTYELQSLVRIPYAVFSFTKNNNVKTTSRHLR